MNSTHFDRQQFYRQIRLLWNDHYRRFIEVLARIIADLLTKEDATNKKMKNILEIGPGEHSVLLDALMRINRSVEISIDFVDKENLKQISSHDNSLSLKLTSPQPPTLGNGNCKLTYNFHNQDFMTWTSELRYTLIVCHNVIHEIYLQSPKLWGEFIHEFFKKIAELLEIDGIAVFGDPYYPTYLQYEDIEKMVELQRKQAGHADPPSAFVDPEALMRTVLQGSYASSTFRVFHDEQRYYSVDNGDIGRKFYIVAFRKISSEVRNR